MQSATGAAAGAIKHYPGHRDSHLEQEQTSLIMSEKEDKKATLVSLEEDDEFEDFPVEGE